MRTFNAALLHSAAVLVFTSFAQPANAQLQPPPDLNQQIQQIQAKLASLIGVIGHDATGSTEEGAAQNCYGIMQEDGVNQGLNCPPGTGVSVQISWMTCHPLPTTDPTLAWTCDCGGTASCQAVY